VSLERMLLVLKLTGMYQVCHFFWLDSLNFPDDDIHWSIHGAIILSPDGNRDKQVN
jgi:hypothetical protein